MMQVRRKASGLLAGYSIIELLIAVIIIGILVAILIPQVANRSRQARINACQADLDHLRSAQERVAIDTSYYFRLYVLDDTRGGDGIGFDIPKDPNDTVDGIQDEQYSVYYQLPPQIFIDPEEQEFVVNYDYLYTLLVRNETSFGWNGPYVNWVRDAVDWEGNAAEDDIPDDPWGRNYLFFTKMGLVREPEGEIVEDADLGWGVTADCLVFDRPTILSMGPNGVPGKGDPDYRFGEGDDIYRQF